MTNRRRVAIIGIGLVTPVGNDVPTTWSNLVAGKSGVDFIRSFDAEEFPVSIAAEVKDFDPSGVASPKEVRKLDRYVLLSLAAAVEAVQDAGLRDFDPARVGIVFGSAIGGFLGIMEQHDVLLERAREGQIDPGELRMSLETYWRAHRPVLVALAAALGEQLRGQALQALYQWRAELARSQPPRRDPPR